MADLRLEIPRSFAAVRTALADIMQAAAAEVDEDKRASSRVVPAIAVLRDIDDESPCAAVGAAWALWQEIEADGDDGFTGAASATGFWVAVAAYVHDAVFNALDGRMGAADIAGHAMLLLADKL